MSALPACFQTRRSDGAGAGSHAAEKRRCRLGEVPLDEFMVVHIAGQEIEQVTLTELQVDGGKAQCCQLRLGSGADKTRLEASRCWGDSVRAGRDGGLAAGDTGGGGARGRGAAETGSCRDLFHTGWPLCAPPPMIPGLVDARAAQPSLPDDQIDGLQTREFV